MGWDGGSMVIETQTLIFQWLASILWSNMVLGLQPLQLHYRKQKGVRKEEKGLISLL